MKPNETKSVKLTGLKINIEFENLEIIGFNQNEINNIEKKIIELKNSITELQNKK